MAAAESIDEDKVLANMLSSVYSTRILLLLALDSPDLFTSLYKQRDSMENYIPSDVIFIRHSFERRQVSNIVWIPGKENLSDPGTKTDSPLRTLFV